MINILLQIIATIFTIAIIFGIKMMDLPVLTTILLVSIIVLTFIFVLAGGLSKRK
jgi:hypothetical protein